MDAITNVLLEDFGLETVSNELYQSMLNCCNLIVSQLDYEHWDEAIISIRNTIVDFTYNKVDVYKAPPLDGKLIKHIEDKQKLSLWRAVCN